MSYTHKTSQPPLEGPMEADLPLQEATGEGSLTYEEPEIELPEEEGEYEDQPIQFAEDDWRFEVQSEAKKTLEALNPDFYLARRLALEAAPEEVEVIPPEVTTLFYSPENILKLMRLTNKGASWKCKENVTNSRGGIKENINNHEKWQIMGCAAPAGLAMVPCMCFRSEGKNGEPMLEFRIA